MTPPPIIPMPGWQRALIITTAFLILVAVAAALGVAPLLRKLGIIPTGEAQS